MPSSEAVEELIGKSNTAEGLLTNFSEERPQVKVTDRRLTAQDSTHDVGTDDTTETEAASIAEARVEAVNERLHAPAPADPVDVLLHRTFQFIISQPEFPALLNLPKPVRKKIGQDFGRMLTRFPHFSKVMANEE